MVDFLILVLIVITSLSTLRFRAWTLFVCYRPNRVLSILLIILQILGQILIDPSCHTYCFRKWPEWINLKFWPYHPNTSTIDKDSRINGLSKAKQFFWKLFDILWTCPKHMHTSTCNVCIWCYVNSTHNIRITHEQLNS